MCEGPVAICAPISVEFNSSQRSQELLKALEKPGEQLPEAQQQKLSKLLCEFKDIFAV